MASVESLTRIHCPLLAFFGTNGDVGNEEDLELLKSSIKRQHTGSSRVDTAMIPGADHMYVGQEDRVAQVIASWADTLSSANAENRAKLLVALQALKALIGERLSRILSASKLIAAREN